MSVEGAASGFAPSVFLGDHDRRRLKPARSGRRWLAIPLLLAGVALAVFARREDADRPQPALPTAFSRIGFVADEALPPMLSFRQADGARANIHYFARIRRPEAERWDTLTVGDVESDDILFQVTLYAAKSAMAKPGLFVDLARQSAELNAAIVYAASPLVAETAHGPIETADVKLAGAKGERRCLGFRLAGSPRIDVFGLACGARGAPLDAAMLGRMIDRLAPTAPGTEIGLGEIFRNSAS
jgi:hypothetical protein